MNTPRIIILIFSTIGVIDTIYLIYHLINKTDVACWFFPPEWCHKVQHAPQSRTFGIPNPILGFIMYVLLLILSIWFFESGASILQWVIWFGFAFSMYFMIIQIFVLRALCTWCVVSAINFSVMFITSFYLR